MKSIEHQLQRLLRAASAARPSAVLEPGKAPDARWLLRQRELECTRIPLIIRPVLQGGLALACLLLMVTLLVNLREIEKVNQDVFAVSEAVLTHISSP